DPPSGAGGTSRRRRFDRTAARRVAHDSVRQAHELKLLVVSLDDALADLAHSRHVVLLLRLWLERTELTGDEHALEGAERHLYGAAETEDVRLVESFAGR